jgi:acetoin utilization deacetylase AcuC-like enzyme
VLRFFGHPDCIGHDPGPGHPESPLRLAAVQESLRALLPEVEWETVPEASRAALQRVHAAALLAEVLDRPESPLRALDEDTRVGPGSIAAALRAAGAGIAAVDWVLSGTGRRAFCAVRPPGHHATPGTAMGFCLFNNIAVAAAHALAAHGLERVAIADFDVHHGNGTQAVFEREPRVLFVGSHQSPLYPGTGREDERGVGNVCNAELAPGTGSEAFRGAWRERLLPAVDAFRPQLLLVSAGFDAHRLDPLAELQLEAGDYAWLTGELAALADRHSAGRLVSMLEGGYSLAALRECSAAHARALQAPPAATRAPAGTLP